MRIYLAAIFGLLASCGHDDSKGAGDAPPPSSFYVQDAASVPPCDASRQGFLVYIGATKKLQACQNGAWADVEIPKGDKGDKGDSGGGITEQYLCAESDDLDGSSDVIVKGRDALITKFASGDYHIYCEDAYSNGSVTDSDTSSSSLFFSATGKAVASGKLSCATLHTVGQFDLAAKSFAWSLDGSNPTASNCKQVTPSPE